MKWSQYHLSGQLASYSRKTKSRRTGELDLWEVTVQFRRGTKRIVKHNLTVLREYYVLYEYEGSYNVWLSKNHFLVSTFFRRKKHCLLATVSLVFNRKWRKSTILHFIIHASIKPNGTYNYTYTTCFTHAISYTSLLYTCQVVNVICSCWVIVSIIFHCSIIMKIGKWCTNGIHGINVSFTKMHSLGSPLSFNFMDCIAINI